MGGRWLTIALAVALICTLVAFWWSVDGKGHSVHPMSETPCTTGGQPITGDDWGQLCIYRGVNSQLIEQKRFPDVVMIGDSITQHWPMPDNGFANRGIGGQVSGQVLLRFSQDAIALRPKVIHILVGINDVSGKYGPESPDMLRNNVRAMVLLAKASDIPVILGTIGPAQDVAWRPQVDRGKWVPVINAGLEQLAREEGMVLADYHAVLADADGSIRKELFADTVHPNLAGYEAMTRVLREALERVDNDSEPSG